MTIHEAYQQVFISLKQVYDENEAANIADMLLEHITGFGKVNRLLNKASNLSNKQQEKLEQSIDQLMLHKPIQQVIGEAWFAGMKFFVNEYVLIPRPETEELVLEVTGYKLPVVSVLDIGTGSGCIPIAMKKKMPDAIVASIDVSNEALNVAQKNAIALHAEIDFKLLDFLDETNWGQLGNYDIIVSNPPYIEQAESAAMSKNVLAFEPHLALFAPDNDALLFYRKIAAFGKTHLNKHGQIFVEINEVLGNETIELFESFGYTATLKKDMQGKDRIIKASLSNNS
jgi:release factor glutamine methyltransferase